jgi:hypothetical protein
VNSQTTEVRPTLASGTSIRTIAIACLITALVSVAASVAIAYVLIGTPAPGPQGQRGSMGPAGPAGSRGARGPAGDEEAIWSAIEGDPERAAAAVQDELDPSPADAQSDAADANAAAAQVADDLDSMCSSLQLTDALSNDYLSCP